jgi:hypothetical protein
MILYIALCIIGIHNVADSLLYAFTGKDLDVYWDMMDGKWYQKWMKPLLFCALCMSSFWGITLQIGYNSPLMFITNIFAVAGVVRIVTAIIDKLDAS